MNNIYTGVSILFTRVDSYYKSLGCDCWDIVRDARMYKGNNPVVVHPPCRAWGILSNMAKPRADEKDLALIAIDFVRKYGGVLEHPRGSKLFPKYIPLPGSVDVFGGYTISIDQFWFGHRAKKSTLLYIVGCPQRDLPIIPIKYDAITHIIGGSNRKRKAIVSNVKKECSLREREATPPDLAVWLCKVAKLCRSL